MSETENKLSKIDAMIAAAKARKAAREAAGEVEVESKPKKEKTEPKARKEKVDNSAEKEQRDQERAARRAQIEQDREARKVEKTAARAAKVAEREEKKNNKAHMSKVDRAAEKLPKLVDFAQCVFDDITVNLGREQLAALAQHILHYNRVKSTERALDTKLEVGQTVRIIGGDPKWQGVKGTLHKVQRIRCYVEVPGANKPVYLFTSDVELIADDVARTGTEG